MARGALRRGMALALAGTGCGNRIQSVLDPASAAAKNALTLGNFMFVIATAVLLLVTVLALVAIVRRGPRDEAGHGDAERQTVFIVVGGIAIPAVILIGLMIMTVIATVRLREPEPGLTVEVEGYRWWWAVRYPEQGIVTANELHIPVGVPVRVRLRSADVIHSFWVPALHGKMDLLPDHDTALTLQAGRPGLFRGQCAEFCGLQHAHMAFEVVALPHAEFDAWVRARLAPTPAPRTEAQRRGKDVFGEAGCAGCHAIAGTPAAGDIGPDLTHIGSRLTLGAGTLPNTRGSLMGWIANPQAIKPGNLMPPTYLSPVDLHALVDYLEMLE